MSGMCCSSNLMYLPYKSLRLACKVALKVMALGQQIFLSISHLIQKSRDLCDKGRTI